MKRPPLEKIRSPGETVPRGARNHEAPRPVSRDRQCERIESAYWLSATCMPISRPKNQRAVYPHWRAAGPSVRLPVNSPVDGEARRYFIPVKMKKDARGEQNRKRTHLHDPSSRRVRAARLEYRFANGHCLHSMPLHPLMSFHKSRQWADGQPDCSNDCKKLIMSVTR